MPPNAGLTGSGGAGGAGGAGSTAATVSTGAAIGASLATTELWIGGGARGGIFFGGGGGGSAMGAGAGGRTISMASVFFFGFTSELSEKLLPYHTPMAFAAI